MPEADERLKKVEDRLDSVEDGLKAVRTEVGELRTEVGGLRGEVGGLRGEVGELRGRTDSLTDDVEKLRVLAEENVRQIRLVAEVQALHGVKLDEITKALEPLAILHTFVQSVSHDHEMRIVALEKRTGVRE